MGQLSLNFFLKMLTVCNLKNTYFEFGFVFLPVMFLSDPLFIDFLNVLILSKYSTQIIFHILFRFTVEQGM